MVKIGRVFFEYASGQTHRLTDTHSSQYLASPPGGAAIKQSTGRSYLNLTTLLPFPTHQHSNALDSTFRSSRQLTDSRVILVNTYMLCDVTINHDVIRWSHDFVHSTAATAPLLCQRQRLGGSTERPAVCCLSYVSESSLQVVAW